jgi:guanylate kinase
MGLLVVISSPSGGGKDSVINELLKIIPNSVRLVTTTSRDLRPGNENGVDYYFVSKEDFKNKIENDEMVEHNNYVGNYYGIEKNKLVEALIKNEVVFTQIEVNGKHNLDKQGIKHLAIFLLPDSLDNLADRIRKRKGVSEEKIKERLETAKQEIEKSVDYDYKIVNKEGELADTITKVRQIIEEKLSIDKKD